MKVEVHMVFTMVLLACLVTLIDIVVYAQFLHVVI